MAGPTDETATPPTPIVVKRIIADGHGGHHGGGWKVAYADFATAMMTFFLLLWILNATTEAQRKGIADYFTPTVIKTQNGGGTNAVMNPRAAGISGTGMDKNPPAPPPTNAQDQKNFEKLEKQLSERIRKDADISNLGNQVRVSRVPEGIRIELIDQAGFSMFALGTDQLEPRAKRLMQAIAESLQQGQTPIIVRGHTDSRSYALQNHMNNWLLSTKRAEATRRTLADAGVREDRFYRLEGLADREPFAPDNPEDPRNRRISITLVTSSVGR